MSEFYKDTDPWDDERTKRREIVVAILIAVAIIGGLIGLSFGMGWIDVGYKNTVGVAEASADRNVFKENKSYVEGMASDLAKYKYELSTEKDATSRKAIVNLIIDKYANFDINKLEDKSLQSFLKDVRNGKYNDGGIK